MLFVSWHPAVTTILTAMATTHTHIDKHTHIHRAASKLSLKHTGHKDTRTHANATATATATAIATANVLSGSIGRKDLEDLEDANGGVGQQMTKSAKLLR